MADEVEYIAPKNLDVSSSEYKKLVEEIDREISPKELFVNMSRVKATTFRLKYQRKRINSLNS